MPRPTENDSPASSPPVAAVHSVHSVLSYCPRLAELLVGLVFLTGAVLKAQDVNLFIFQIKHYGVFEEQILLNLSALGTLWIETALGIALLLGLRLRGLTSLAALTLLAGFTGLIAYGWAFHNLKDCGCFGRIEISPQVSIAKNVVLVLLTAFAWWGRWKRPAHRTKIPLTLAKMAICLAAASAIVVYARNHIEAIPESARPFAQFVFDLDDIHYDLDHGEYFVAMLSMDCPECMATVPAINDLTEIPDFPPVVALCYEETTGALDTFREATAPTFPLYSLGDKILTFSNLIGDAPPRFYLERDGEPIACWDLTVPAPEQVLQARENPAAQ